ncbi:MAG: hypothetical protein OXG55_05140 [bacterium]|nr:hypothetical protein [bacterium]
MMIEDLTDSVGRYVWLQRHLAESLRLWGVGEKDGAVAVYLHQTARRFAEHGTDWEALLADSPALGATERVRAPSPGWEELFRGAATGTSDRLVVLLHVVLPRLRSSLERFAAQLGDVAEAAEGRFCAIVAGDLQGIEARGLALLDERATAPSQRRMAARLGRRLADLSC